jgi:hypothetical protein
MVGATAPLQCRFATNIFRCATGGNPTRRSVASGKTDADRQEATRCRPRRAIQNPNPMYLVPGPVRLHTTAHQTAVDDKAKEAAQLAKSDEEMAAEKKDVLEKSADEKADWPKKCKELYKTFYKAQYAALQAQYNETGPSKIPIWGDLWNAYYEYRQEHYLKAAGYLGLAAFDAWASSLLPKAYSPPADMRSAALRVE